MAKLANVESLPSMEDVEKFKENKDLVKILKSSVDEEQTRENLHYHCKKLLQENKVLDAWSIPLIENQIKYKMSNLSVEGKLKRIHDEQVISDRFKKREFVIETEEQYLKF